MPMDFREKGGEGERGEKEKNRCERSVYRLPLKCISTGDQTRNLGMCPDWELNPQPFGLRDDAQPTEPHQPGLLICFTAAYYSVVWQNHHLFNQPLLMASVSNLLRSQTVLQSIASACSVPMFTGYCICKTSSQKGNSWSENTHVKYGWLLPNCPR